MNLALQNNGRTVHRQFSLLLLVSIAVFALTACSQVNSEAEDLGQRPLRAVATTGMIADVVANVGGERVDVVGLMGPGVDPHLYQASEGDVSRLRDADVIFYNGLHLEAQMANVLERMNESDRVTVAVTEQIDENQLLDSPTYVGNFDPHVWFDVSLWMEAVNVVQETLAEVDPEHAETYRSNGETYLEELAVLHAYVEEQVARVPEQQRVLVTAHDAFGYFGEAYGFEVRGLQGISTEAEASTADVQELARFIAQWQIPALFIESSVPQRNVEAVQAAVQAQGFDVVIGGELFSDAMGSPGTEEGTYIGMVRHNVDTIVGALLGEDGLAQD